jgi:hypothetical protein
MNSYNHFLLKSTTKKLSNIATDKKLINHADSDLLNSLPLFSLASLGGLFSPLPNDDHHSTDPQEIAFRYAVDKINADNKILPRSKLYAEIERIMPQDSFHASKRVCHLMKTGVAAIFGPQSSHTASHVQSICDTMEVSERLKHQKISIMNRKMNSNNANFLRFPANSPHLRALKNSNGEKIPI